jgi:hypothetical protein
MELIKKGSNYLLKNDEVRLENEIAISEIVCDSWATIQTIPKNPPYTSSDYSSLEFQLPIE